MLELWLRSHISHRHVKLVRKNLTLSRHQCNDPTAQMLRLIRVVVGRMSQKGHFLTLRLNFLWNY